MKPLTPLVLDYRRAARGPKHRCRPFDVGAFIALGLGLFICVPFVAGIFGIIFAIPSFRAADATVGERLVTMLAMVAGVFNCGLWATVSVSILLSALKQLP